MKMSWGSGIGIVASLVTLFMAGLTLGLALSDSLGWPLKGVKAVVAPVNLDQKWDIRPVQDPELTKAIAEDPELAKTIAPVLVINPRECRKFRSAWSCSFYLRATRACTVSVASATRIFDRNGAPHAMKVASVAREEQGTDSLWPLSPGVLTLLEVRFDATRDTSGLQSLRLVINLAGIPGAEGMQSFETPLHEIK